jgi:hypothetical protein
MQRAYTIVPEYLRSCRRSKWSQSGLDSVGAMMIEQVPRSGVSKESVLSTAAAPWNEADRSSKHIFEISSRDWQADFMLPGFKPNIWEVARRSPRPSFDVSFLILAYTGHITWVLNPEPYDNHIITTITIFSYNYMVMKFHHCPELPLFSRHLS